MLLSLALFNPFRAEEREGEEGESETEALRDKFLQEFEQLKDPALGTVPNERLVLANEATKASQRSATASRTTALNWQERGPIYDAVSTLR